MTYTIDEIKKVSLGDGSVVSIDVRVFIDEGKTDTYPPLLMPWIAVVRDRDLEEVLSSDEEINESNQILLNKVDDLVQAHYQVNFNVADSDSSITEVLFVSEPEVSSEEGIS